MVPWLVVTGATTAVTPGVLNKTCLSRDECVEVVDFPVPVVVFVFFAVAGVAGIVEVFIFQVKVV